MSNKSKYSILIIFLITLVIFPVYYKNKNVSNEIVNSEISSPSLNYENVLIYIKEGNNTAAFELLTKCDTFAPCQTLLGYFYAQNSIGNDHNKSLAIFYSKEAIKVKSVKAMHNLGVIYLKDKNYKEAVKYLSMGAENRSHEANYNMGLIYLYGWGVDKNITKSYEYMNEANNLGSTKSLEVIRYLKTVM
jgi:TPR repeat protein